MLSFPSFSTNEQAKYILWEIEKNIDWLLKQKDTMKTTRILHDEPEVRRVWWQLGDIRISFHKIFPCDECFFHPHPWPSLVKCLQWWYTHRIGLYNGNKQDVEKLTPDDIAWFSATLVPMETTISSWDYYTMPDIRQFHQVSTSDYSYSLMITWLPYFPWATKQFSRKVPDVNIELTQEQIDDILSVVREYYKIG